MATTILAVDDSATMRRILEITFAGTDFQVVVVASGNDAIGRMQQGGFGLVICDNSLEQDGYEVARQIKSVAPSVPLLFLSSRQNPYDATKGQAARIDDHIDKPFDTQQLIDRATKLAQGGAGVGLGATVVAPQQSPLAAAAAAAAGPAPAAAAAQKNRTMMYGGAVQQPAPAPAPAAQPARAAGFGAGGLGSKAASPAPAQTAPKPAPAAAPAPAARPAVAATAASAMAAGNGQLAAKMGELGLSPQQAEAVLALSRDIIERVVWEVVPVLAETLIKEEISRLTK